MKRWSTKARIACAVLALACGLTTGIVTTAAPAGASGTSIVWNHTGGSVPMYWGTRTSGGIESWMAESSHFQMTCWVDDQSYYGNYWSSRWFFGQSYSNGRWGYVPASFVYYQVGVPHC